MEKQAPKQEIVDIPLGTLHRITSGLEKVYGEGNVVVIGGRAVNLLCSISYRPTHDIDLVVPRRPIDSDMLMLPDKARSPHEYFYHEGDINDRARAKLCYVAQTVTDPVGIDLYYPFYSTRGGFDGGRHIGGVVPVPIDAVLKEHTTVKMGGLKFSVTKLEVLAVMKYNTFIERGVAKEDSKDMVDLRNIFRNHANNPDDFVMLMKKINMFLERHVPEKAGSTIIGMLRSVDFNSISRDIGNEARSLLRNQSRLR